MRVGEVICAPGSVGLNAGRPVAELDVANVGDRPVQVGSHLHFFEANRCLSFDRAAAFGYRLDVPSGTSVRFEPGEVKRVRLVSLAGARRVLGLNGLTQGPLDAPGAAAAALDQAGQRGFLAYAPGVAVGFDGRRYALGGADRVGEKDGAPAGAAGAQGDAAAGTGTRFSPKEDGTAPAGAAGRGEGR